MINDSANSSERRTFGIKTSFLSARKVSTVLFILLPSIAISLLIYEGYMKSGELSSLRAVTDPIRLYALRMLPIALFIYGLYPAAFSSKKYFEKSGFQNIIIEFQYVKKILYVEVTILSVSALISIIILYIPLPFPSPYTPLELNNIIVLPIMFVMLFSSVGGMLRINSQIAKKEFRWLFAKACFRMSSENADDLEKIHYMMFGLSSYNKYLRRHLKYQIQEKYILMIYSNFMRMNVGEKNEIINSLMKAFEDNKSAPVGCLSNILKVPLTEELLSRESLVDKLKGPSAALVAGIPIIVSIIELVIRSGK